MLAPRTLVGERPLVLRPAGDAVPGHRGQEHPAEELARQGFVVVPVSVNGVDAEGRSQASHQPIG